MMGGSPGLVVKGGDTYLKGWEFESQHRILDGHFDINLSEKNTSVCLKRPKIKHGYGKYFKK